MVSDVEIQVFFGTENFQKEENINVRRTTWKDGQDIIRINPAHEGEPYQLGIPLELAESFCKHGNWMMQLELERLLLPFERVILHASAVIYQGQAYVFTAPSGTGKSTQADIWNRELGAEIMNGDKVVISVKDGKCIAYGSPVAGSSGIYKNIEAPIAAIIQLQQSDMNMIVQASKVSEYFALYSGMVKSSYDSGFNQRLLPCIEKILQRVPVLTLACRPEREAAECVLKWMQFNASQGECK